MQQTLSQIAETLDREHAAQFAPVSKFDAPTFAPKDIADLCGVDDDTVTRHARNVIGFPSPIEPNGWHLTWKRHQWPVVLLTFLKACPKARRNLANRFGLSIFKTGAEVLVSEVLRNPFKPVSAQA